MCRSPKVQRLVSARDRTDAMDRARPYERESAAA